MRDVIPFEFEDQLFRSIVLDGEPWFVAKDVCSVLGLKNSREAISKLDEDEKGVITNDTLGGNQEFSTISESGFYALVLKSRKPEAKRVRKWVTSEVLPAIRKTGKYEIDPAPDPTEYPLPHDVDTWLSLVREARLLKGEYAADAIWKQSPLPPLPEKPVAPVVGKSEFEKAFHEFRKNPPIPAMTAQQIADELSMRCDEEFGINDVVRMLQKFAQGRRQCRIHRDGRGGPSNRIWFLTSKPLSNDTVRALQAEYKGMAPTVSDVGSA